MSLLLTQSGHRAHSSLRSSVQGTFMPQRPIDPFYPLWRVAIANCNTRDGRARRPAFASQTEEKEFVMSVGRKIWLGVMALFAAIVLVSMPPAAQQQQRPNIIFIMA